MDFILSKVTQHAMNYAIRSGITLTSGYAIQQCGRLLKNAPKGKEREELATLQLRLESKIRIISPAIDMIELIAARGNTSLESAVTLTKSVRLEIESLGNRLSQAAVAGELARRSKRKRNLEDEMELKRIIADIKKLLDRIEDAVPLINLAITTSGVNLSTSLPSTVSPSRLLQASFFLSQGDQQYTTALPRYQQVGPVFTLSMYMLFSGHATQLLDEERVRETTWKEVMHKARVKLLRVPLDKVSEHPLSDGVQGSHQGDEPSFASIPSSSKAHEFAYQLLVVEDLDDDRVHDEEESEFGPYDDVAQAGIREIIPIHQISKIFYADTGKILNIGAEGEPNNPILLLKRDVNAVPPRRMMERETVEPESPEEYEQSLVEEEELQLMAQIRRESSVDPSEAESPPKETQPPLHHPWRLPPDLDLEWIAFEVYAEEPPSDSEVDDSDTDVPDDTPSKPAPTRSSSLEPSITARMSSMFLGTPPPLSPGTPTPPNTQLILSPQKAVQPAPQAPTPSPPPLKTSLSLLEMLIRLTALQQFQQNTHLMIADELLTFFLSESSTVGAGGNEELRRRARWEARRRVGFDPYDESPIKRRGEEYLSHVHGGEAEAVDRDTDYDYETYPTGRSRYSRSRSGTPMKSYAPSSPLSSPPPVSSSEVPLPSRETRPQALKPSLASPSPLLRRATVQPGFRGHANGHFTAPNTSSSPRADVRGPNHSHRSVAPETPPPSEKKGA